jgi:hypothetical protein
VRGGYRDPEDKVVTGFIIALAVLLIAGIILAVVLGGGS